MDDTISRQAVIDALYDWSEHSMTDAEAWHIRQVIGDIKSMPSVQPEIIRCKDCKYGKQDEVGRWFCQIGNEDGSGYRAVRGCQSIVDGTSSQKKLTDDGDKAVCLSWYSFHGWEWGENPIAWMPLPEPYREEGEQE